jgi:excinuclease UvrABC ATPase subunit
MEITLNKTAVCPFCDGTGIATFIDISKVHDDTSMFIGDETWKNHKELGACPEGCTVLN